VIDIPETEEQRPVPRDGDNCRTIPVTCRIHGAAGLCNLRLTKVDGDIVLDPHVADSCVIIFNENAATALFDVLGQWLG
jgi:hypothetical protein